MSNLYLLTLAATSAQHDSNFFLVRADREALPAGMVPRSGRRKPPDGVRLCADARDLEGHGGASRRGAGPAHRCRQLQLPVHQGPDELLQGQAVGAAGLNFTCLINNTCQQTEICYSVVFQAD